MNIQKAYDGARTTAGIVTLEPAGLPQHLREGASRLAPGSGNTGEQRVFGVPHVFVHDTPLKTLRVRFPAAVGSVTLEACDGDPSVAADWYTVGTAITASGAAVDNNVRKFVRVNLGTAGGGVEVSLVASSG